VPGEATSRAPNRPASYTGPNADAISSSHPLQDPASTCRSCTEPGNRALPRVPGGRGSRSVTGCTASDQSRRMTCTIHEVTMSAIACPHGAAYGDSAGPGREPVIRDQGAAQPRLTGQEGTGVPADGRAQPAAGPLRPGELLDEALTTVPGPVDDLTGGAIAGDMQRRAARRPRAGHYRRAARRPAAAAACRALGARPRPRPAVPEPQAVTEPSGHRGGLAGLASSGGQRLVCRLPGQRGVRASHPSTVTRTTTVRTRTAASGMDVCGSSM
jgi:hypothetical protein